MNTDCLNALSRAIEALDAARLAALPARTQAEDEIDRAVRLIRRAIRRLEAPCRAF